MTADRAKLCIDSYWEVMGGLLIAAALDPSLFHNLTELGISKLHHQIRTKRRQMEQHFELMEVVKS